MVCWGFFCLGVWGFFWLRFMSNTTRKYWNTAVSCTNYSVTPFFALSLHWPILNWASSNSVFVTCLAIKAACWLIFLSVKMLKRLSGGLSSLPYNYPEMFYVTLFSDRVLMAMDSPVDFGEFAFSLFSPSSFGLSRSLGIWRFSSFKLSSPAFWTDKTGTASSPCSHLHTALEVIRKTIFLSFLTSGARGLWMLMWLFLISNGGIFLNIAVFKLKNIPVIP